MLDVRRQATPAELKARIEAARTGEPFAFYFDADGRQHVVALDDVAQATVGRAEDADVCLGWDPQVSRLHAVLERVGESWVVADDGLSSNGTFVNEERLRGRRRLADGDVIRAGATAIVIRVPSRPAHASTVPDLQVEIAAAISPAQRRVLVALCRPYRDGDPHAIPATNPQIAEALVLSVPAVKTHLRALFARFGIEDLPQQEKRQRLVAMAFATGVVRERDLEG